MLGAFDLYLSNSINRWFNRWPNRWRYILCKLLNKKCDLRLLPTTNDNSALACLHQTIGLFKIINKGM